MSFDDFAIRATALSKCYTLFDRPADRLKQMLVRGRRKYYREYWALRETSFDVGKGEVLGLVGRNGAGKSTLLQLVCGTLSPTGGKIEVRGRVAALLELGAGFSPEFSGRENVYLSASILGLEKTEIDRRFDEIVRFSGIGDFIEQPVKTYSSGMFMRLAFSVATSVDPDILIIDEALSVGDGDFARKSFDRIRTMKEAGKTILFCSHSLYQVETFCDRALWLDRGQCMLHGDPQEVIRRYTESLLMDELGPAADADVSIPQVNASPTLPVVNSRVVQNEAVIATEGTQEDVQTAAETVYVPVPEGHARFSHVEVSLDGMVGRELQGRPGENDLSVVLRFASDPRLPTPAVGATIKYGSLIEVTCAVSLTDEVRIERDEFGRGQVRLDFPRIPLRKGEYFIWVHLGCENAVYIYETVLAATLTMIDPLPEPGLVNLVHTWQAQAGHGGDGVASAV